ncbi:hypothetical protein [Halorhabdus rudnickae]|uniref:hypothetical protein n=1 Tax=Halorhabdus rudnickae TaxID=1775544 RepID=UPI001083E1E0|nr:hypothetical protein [Halorhabdus rudnickae]
MDLNTLEVGGTDEPEWVSEPAEIAELLYSLDQGETIAVKIERSWGTMLKHITITKGPYPDVKNYASSSLAEPYDVILNGESRRNPSADFAETRGISHDPDEGTVYFKMGVGRFDELEAVTTDTLAVSYEAEVDVAAECSDCGQTTRIPVSQEDLPRQGPQMVDSDDGLLTPCCRSENWKTTLVETV